MATGREIGAEGLNPVFPPVAEPVERLSVLARERALELHLPVVGKKSRSVLMPMDVEIFLAQHNHRIYSSRASQRELLTEVMPVIRFLGDLLRNLYEDSSFGWSSDFFRRPSNAKANDWARCYSAIALWSERQLSV